MLKYSEWLTKFADGNFTSNQKMLNEIAGQIILMEKLIEQLYISERKALKKVRELSKVNDNYVKLAS